MKMIKNIRFINGFILFVFMALTSISLNAQDMMMISGTILDNETGEPIPGVNVVEINENDRIIGGGITDFDGNFVVPITSRGNRLMISFIGYKAQKVSIASFSSGQSINLIPDVQAIDQIDVVAEVVKTESDGFMTLTEREKTTASVKIDLKEVENVSSSSVAEAIQGRLAGVDISASSGDPGAGLQIQVRGNTSLFGEDSSPLIVVNDLPYETNTDDFDFSSGDANDYSELLDIPVEDILSLEIKKDAASAAVYGGKASNGVVIIKTKRGVKGKPRVEYTIKTAWKDQPDPIPMLNGDQYSTMMLEGIFNANNGLAATQPIELSYDPNYEFYHEYSQNTDWIKEITQQGFSQSHNLSISGGGEQSRYRISGSYYDEEGTTVGTGLERFNTRMALDYNISKSTMLTADFSYTHTDQNKIYDINSSNQPQLRSKAYRKAPNMSIYEWALNPGLNIYEETDTYFSPRYNYQGSGDVWYNPVASANESYRNVVSDALRSNLSLNVNIGKGFSIRSYVVATMNNKQTRAWNPQVVTGQRFSDGSTNRVSKNDGQSLGVQHRTNFSYNKKFSAQGIADMLGANPEDANQTLKLVTSYEIKINNSTSMSGTGSNTASGLEYFYTPSRISAGNSKGTRKRRRQGAAIFVGHYGLFSKYFLQGSFRTDGDSRISRESRFKGFWSVGGSWNFSEEFFLRDLRWFDLGKVRYSYGTTGNLPNDIQYRGTYGTAGEYIDMSAADPNNLQLDNLNYAITTQRNLGFQLKFFKRVSVELDFYDKQTDDIIIKDYSIPSTSGFSSLSRGNFGSISNQGIEFSGQYLVLKNKKWDVTLNMNVSTNKNKVEWLPENYSPSEGNPHTNGNYLRQINVGQPVGAFYGYKFEGVYSTDDDNFILDRNGNVVKNPDGSVRRVTFNDGTVFKGGDAKYTDVNGDGVINQYDIVYLGSPHPDYYGGFGLKVKYQNFYVNTHFQFSTGMEVFNKTRMVTENMYSRNNQSVAVLNRWRKPGDVTNIPRALYDEGYNWLASDRFIEDNSYLRFKTLTVGYNLSKRLTKQIGLNSARFYVTFYNLYTWTNYTGQDPEVGSGRTAKWNDIGVDNSRTPPPSNVTFGLSVNF